MTPMATPTGPQNHSASPNLHNVLLIEDEPALLDAYANILTNAGYLCRKALDGIVGLKLLAENKDEIGLVITGMMLPKMDGLEVIQEIRTKPQTYGTPKIVALTNLMNIRVVEEIQKKGADMYLIKTETEFEQLVTEIQKLSEPGYSRDEHFKEAIEHIRKETGQ